MKRHIIFFLFSLSVSTLPAQTQPVQLWQSVEYVKSINIKGPTIALDKFQNTYMLTNQTDESPFSGFTLVKYDTLGNALWKRHSQISIIGVLYGSFTVDSTGNAYVSQWYDGGLPGYDADALLIRYAPDGTKLWEANYGLGQTGDSYIYYSEMDTLNGRLITLGMNLHDTIPAENFLFVQAVDTSDGSVVWRTKISGVFRPQNLRVQSGHIQLLSTKYKPDSKYFVNTLLDFEGNVTAQYEKPYSGYTVDFNCISKTGDVIFGNRAFGYNVTRVNIKGDTLWAYEHPLTSGTNENRAVSLVEDDSSNVYVSGTIELPTLSRELVTTKFDAFGDVIWQKIYHSENDSLIDYGNHITLFKENAIVSGASQFANNDIVGIITLYDPWEGKEGYIIFVSSENVFRINEAYYFRGKVFYASEGYQSNISNMVVVTGCFLIPKISPVNEIDSTYTLSPFPNPTSDLIFISNINLCVFNKISVCDSQGNIIINKKIEAAQEKILLSGFPPGLYTICVHGKNIQVNKKIIKI